MAQQNDLLALSNFLLALGNSKGDHFNALLISILPKVLALSSSPHQSIKNKVMDILEFIEIKLSSLQTVFIPLIPLITLFHQTTNLETQKHCLNYILTGVTRQPDSLINIRLFPLLFPKRFKKIDSTVQSMLVHIGIVIMPKIYDAIQSSSHIKLVDYFKDPTLEPISEHISLIYSIKAIQSLYLLPVKAKNAIYQHFLNIILLPPVSSVKSISDPLISDIPPGFCRKSYLESLGTAFPFLLDGRSINPIGPSSKQILSTNLLWQKETCVNDLIFLRKISLIRFLTCTLPHSQTLKVFSGASVSSKSTKKKYFGTDSYSLKSSSVEENVDPSSFKDSNGKVIVGIFSHIRLFILGLIAAQDSSDPQLSQLGDRLVNVIQFRRRRLEMEPVINNSKFFDLLFDLYQGTIPLSLFPIYARCIRRDQIIENSNTYQGPRALNISSAGQQLPLQMLAGGNAFTPPNLSEDEQKTNIAVLESFLSQKPNSWHPIEPKHYSSFYFLKRPVAFHIQQKILQLFKLACENAHRQNSQPSITQDQLIWLLKTSLFPMRYSESFSPEIPHNTPAATQAEWQQTMIGFSSIFPAAHPRDIVVRQIYSGIDFFQLYLTVSNEQISKPNALNIFWSLLVPQLSRLSPSDQNARSHLYNCISLFFNKHPFLFGEETAISAPSWRLLRRLFSCLYSEKNSQVLINCLIDIAHVLHKNFTWVALKHTPSTTDNIVSLVHFLFFEKNPPPKIRQFCIEFLNILFPDHTPQAKWITLYGTIDPDQGVRNKSLELLIQSPKTFESTPDLDLWLTFALPKCFSVEKDGVTCQHGKFLPDLLGPFLTYTSFTFYAQVWRWIHNEPGRTFKQYIQLCFKEQNPSVAAYIRLIFFCIVGWENIDSSSQEKKFLWDPPVVSALWAHKSLDISPVISLLIETLSVTPDALKARIQQLKRRPIQAIAIDCIKVFLRHTPKSLYPLVFTPICETVRTTKLFFDPIPPSLNHLRSGLVEWISENIFKKTQLVRYSFPSLEFSLVVSPIVENLFLESHRKSLFNRGMTVLTEIYPKDLYMNLVDYFGKIKSDENPLETTETPQTANETNSSQPSKSDSPLNIEKGSYFQFSLDAIQSFESISTTLGFFVANASSPEEIVATLAGLWPLIHLDPSKQDFYLLFQLVISLIKRLNLSKTHSTLLFKKLVKLVVSGQSDHKYDVEPLIIALGHLHRQKSFSKMCLGIVDHTEPGLGLIIGQTLAIQKKPLDAFLAFSKLFFSNPSHQRFVNLSLWLLGFLKTLGPNLFKHVSIAKDTASKLSDPINLNSAKLSLASFCGYLMKITSSMTHSSVQFVQEIALKISLVFSESLKKAKLDDVAQAYLQVFFNNTFSTMTNLNTLSQVESIKKKRKTNSSENSSTASSSSDSSQMTRADLSYQNRSDVNTVFDQISSLASRNFGSIPHLIPHFLNVASSSSFWSSKSGSAYVLTQLFNRQLLDHPDIQKQIDKCIPALWVMKYDPDPQVAQAMEKVWQIFVVRSNSSIRMQMTTQQIGSYSYQEPFILSLDEQWWADTMMSVDEQPVIYTSQASPQHKHFLSILKYILSTFGNKQWKSVTSACLSLPRLFTQDTEIENPADLEKLWQGLLEAMDATRAETSAAASSAFYHLGSLIASQKSGSLYRIYIDTIVPLLIDLGLPHRNRKIVMFSLFLLRKLLMKNDAAIIKDPHDNPLEKHTPNLVVPLLQTLTSLEPAELREQISKAKGGVSSQVAKQLFSGLTEKDSDAPVSSSSSVSSTSLSNEKHISNKNAIESINSLRIQISNSTGITDILNSCVNSITVESLPLVCKSLDSIISSPGLTTRIGTYNLISQILSRYKLKEEFHSPLISSMTGFLNILRKRLVSEKTHFSLEQDLLANLVVKIFLFLPSSETREVFVKKISKSLKIALGCSASSSTSHSHAKGFHKHLSAQLSHLLNKMGPVIQEFALWHQRLAPATFIAQFHPIFSRSNFPFLKVGYPSAKSFFSFVSVGLDNSDWSTLNILCFALIQFIVDKTRIQIPFFDSHSTPKQYPPELVQVIKSWSQKYSTTKVNEDVVFEPSKWHHHLPFLSGILKTPSLESFPFDEGQTDAFIEKLYFIATRGVLWEGKETVFYALSLLFLNRPLHKKLAAYTTFIRNKIFRPKLHTSLFLSFLSSLKLLQKPEDLVESLSSEIFKSVGKDTLVNKTLQDYLLICKFSSLFSLNLNPKNHATIVQWALERTHNHHWGSLTYIVSFFTHILDNLSDETILVFFNSLIQLEFDQYARYSLVYQNISTLFSASVRLLIHRNSTFNSQYRNLGFTLLEKIGGKNVPFASVEIENSIRALKNHLPTK